MPFGGGGGGSQTVVQQSTPFNAQQLNTVENAAINLGQNNPINFTPNPTYAPPNDLQISSLNGAGSQAFNAGQATSPWIGPQQLSGILANNGIVSGDTIRALQPFINQFSNLAGVNPAQSSIDNLQTNFGMGNPYFQELANPANSLPGSQLGYIGGGGLSPTGFINSLANPMGIAGAPQLGTVAGGGYLNGVSPQLYQLASAGTNGPGATALSYYGNGGASSAISPYASGLTDFGYGASNAISPYTRGLSTYAGGSEQAVSPYTSGLTGVASGGPAAGQLAATAQGQYLGQNPFLNQMFQSAANPVVNAYETATAPTIDSQMNTANRFGSGANFVQQSTAQQNLGKTLSDLQANIYGPAYNAERSNMVNAATNLGGLQTNAYGTAGQLTNAATGLGISGYGQAGQLQNAATGYGIQGLEGAGQLVNTGVGQGITAANAAANQYNSGLTNFLNAYNQGVNTLSGAANNLFTGNVGALGTGGNLSNTGAQIQSGAASSLLNNQTTGLSNALTSGIDAAKAAGSLGVLGTAQQIAANQGAASTYNTGVNQMLAGIGNVGALSQMPLSDYNAAYGTGAQQQALNQAQINDLNQRFYGNEMSPWSTLQLEAGLVGNAITGSSSTQTPFFANPLQGLSSTVGALGGAKNLFSGIGGSGAGALSAIPGAEAGFPAFASLGTAAGSGLGTGIATDLATGITSDVAPSAFAAAAPFAFLGSVVCTELMRQEKMPRRWWMINSKHDRYIPKWIKDGYYVWAIPAVEHMRKSPDSFYSKLLSKAFLARSENIAHVMGVRDARRRWYGSLITGAIGVVSIACAAVKKPRDLWSLYSNDELKKLVRVR